MTLGEGCVPLWRMDSQGPDPLLPVLVPRLCGPSPRAWAGPPTDGICVIKLHQIVMPSSKETLSLESPPADSQQETEALSPMVHEAPNSANGHVSLGSSPSPVSHEITA